MAAKIVIRVAVAVGLIAGLAFVARAETPPPPDEGGRYLLRKAQDGWFRIDQKTGRLPCARSARPVTSASWFPMIAMPCSTRSRALPRRTRCCARNWRAPTCRRATCPASPSAPDASGADAGKNDDGSALPTEEDIDRMMGAFRLMVERFLAMVKDLQDQLSEPSGN